jgi:Astacin (Peptidase family M12A)
MNPPAHSSPAARSHLNRCVAFVLVCLAQVAFVSMAADSDPAHCARDLETPLPWPDGIIPYDVSALAPDQQATVRHAMQRWMDTGARIAFVPRTSQKEYVNFTGRTDAGNNTSQTGFKPGTRADINITAFWWNQGEWMPAHELGHAIGFHHEHARWDRDAYVTIHYENIKPGRAADYDWIPRTNWLVNSTPYDYHSIMHYRVCWASSCESQCHDADGSSPCAVIDPIGTNYDAVVGQWDHNGISAGDADKARRAYGTNQTVYVRSDHPTDGSGTLENPYRDLAHASRQCPEHARIILLSAEGSWSVKAPLRDQRGPAHQ